MITDLRYAVYFLSYSITVLKNADLPDGFSMGPNSVLSLKDAEGGDVTASVEVLKGDVDIDSVMKMITDLVRMWYESRGIKSNAGGNGNAGNAESAVALVMQEGDTTEDRKKQITFFRRAEKEFFCKLGLLHNYIVDANATSEDTPAKKFSDKLKVTTEFTPVIEHIEDQVDEATEDKIEE